MVKRKNQYRCVIFDDVLVNTDIIVISSLIDLADSYDVRMELDEAIKLFSGKGIYESLLIIQSKCKQTFPQNIWNKFSSQVHQEFMKDAVAVEGAENLLNTLPLSFCVISNISREETVNIFHLTGLIRFFNKDNIFSHYDAGSQNWSPAIFHFAAKKMGFTTSECIVIGECYAGIQAAVAGGLKVYGLSNGFNNNTLESYGAVVFESLYDLPKLLLAELAGA